MKFIKNLIFLFKNELPDRSVATFEKKCDYCGETDGWEHYSKTGMTICYGCMKKIADRVLKEAKQGAAS